MTRWLVLLIALTFPAISDAHGFNPALLRLKALGNGRYDVQWKPPSGQEGGTPTSVAPVFPTRCRLNGLDTLDCGSSIAGETIAVSGLAEAHVDAVVEVEEAGTVSTLVLRADAPSALLPEAAKPALEPSFLKLGIEHILTGYDHLLFVLGLVLLVGVRWRLLGTITAFTVAHSITLALTTFGVVQLAQPPVEACIALSILLLAVELARPDRDTLARRRPWVLAFVFGLLHGFGFAAALGELGLAPERIPSALLLFNLGVEFGQLAFVLVVAGILSLISLSHTRAQLFATRFATWTIGSMAAFWCIDRVASFAS